MPATKKRNREPIPGYRLIESLGRGGCGEVWKCEAPGGLYKAIKFVEGERALLTGEAGPADVELRSIQHIKSLRHPFLLSMERVESIDGELVIVMELADASLSDVLKEHRARGLAGIPRRALLRYLCEAADALDMMSLRHGLQHLDVKPGNLLLVGNHIKVADFGLVRRLADCGASHANAFPAGGLTALYAAPELFRNSIGPSCDQYSLAIVYQELLTGTLPFQGKNARQLALQHANAEPDLSALPAEDRAAVARALSKDPTQRFPSCTGFMQALVARHKKPAGPAMLSETFCFASVDNTEQIETSRPESKQRKRSGKRHLKRESEKQEGLTTHGQAGASVLLAELILEARAEQPERVANRDSGSRKAGIIEDRFPARISPAKARARLESFRHQWNAKAERTLDDGAIFHVPLPGGFWQRWFGRARGLTVELRWSPPSADSSMPQEISVRIHGSPKLNSTEELLVAEVGPLILESLQAHLEAIAERRTEVRAPWPHPVRVTFYHPQEERNEILDGKGKDISLGGMGLFLPRAFAGSKARIELFSPSRGKPIALLGQCVRVQRCADGWFETGILF